MAMSKSANAYNRVHWEESDFPILCQTCLGDNPFLRMMREKHGKECKVCSRPFTVFRWCPGAKMRFKKTEVCQTCSKTKNVCQTCLLDLEYGLPVQVRDSAYNLDKEDIPKSDVGKEFYTQMKEQEIAQTDGTMAVGELGKARKPSAMLMKMARTTPYYKRNRPHICSFWVKGECRRGEECPYRHEKPTDPDDPLSEQNIKDRFFGVNDPVADKLMNRYQDMSEEDHEVGSGKKALGGASSSAEAASSLSIEIEGKEGSKPAGQPKGGPDFFNLNTPPPLMFPPPPLHNIPYPPPMIPPPPMLPPPPGMMPPPPGMMLPPNAPPPSLLYPSQDPSRLGAAKKLPTIF